MTESLSEAANDLKLSRIAFLCGPLSRDDVSALEGRLREDPYDMVARATLLAHHTKHSPNRGGFESLSTPAIEHIRWFVTNIPDSSFCSERWCFVPKQEPAYEELKELWLSIVAKDPTVNRRVNAYLLFVGNNDPQCTELFEEWFNDAPNESWTGALRRIADMGEEWANTVVDSQLKIARAKEGVDCEHVFQSPADELRHLAADSSSAGTIAEFRAAVYGVRKNSSDMRNRAIILGYTFGNYWKYNELGFDPELAAIRFENMCWFIVNMPSSEFLQSAFAADPLMGLDSFNQGLASIWLDQVRRTNDCDQVIVNAAIFCHKLGNDAMSNPLANELMKTARTKRIFKKVARQFGVRAPAGQSRRRSKSDTI